MESYSIMSVNLNKLEFFKTAKEIDIGYATREALRKCINIKEIDILHFKKDFKLSLTNLYK